MSHYLIIKTEAVEELALLSWGAGYVGVKVLA